MTMNEHDALTRLSQWEPLRDTCFDADTLAALLEDGHVELVDIGGYTAVKITSSGRTALARHKEI